MFPRSLVLLIDRHIDCILLTLAFAMRDVRELFRAHPRPSDAPLIAGIAPAEEADTRTLSGSQLEQLHNWVRLHQEGWRRHASPPSVPSYSVKVEHSDGTKTDVLFFTRIRPEIRFCQEFKSGRRDGGWLAVPLIDVERLISLLRTEV